MKKRRASGMFIYALFVAVVLFILYSSMGNSQATYSITEFRSAIKAGEVKSVVISQNEQVPTGSAQINLSNGKVATLYVSDVNDLQTQLDKAKVTYTLSDVPHDSWISELLPMLIVLGAVFILFMIMMNAQNSGGGGANARMMNFGKSRARLTNKEDIHTRFDDVAGLKEENISLSGICTFKHHDTFFSARRLGINSGRIYTAILLKKSSLQHRLQHQE